MLAGISGPNCAIYVNGYLQVTEWKPYRVYAEIVAPYFALCPFQQSRLEGRLKIDACGMQLVRRLNASI